ncbi:MAG: Ig-like domain-containing protein, partial [Sulfurovum sp.]|nr:Ig-like domain-containing protein [Sulfurovum sp.]
PKEGVKITGVSTHTYTITDDDTLPPVTDSNVTVPTTPTNNANETLNGTCGAGYKNGTVKVTTLAANGFTNKYDTDITLDASGKFNIANPAWKDGSWQISLACKDEHGNGPANAGPFGPNVVDTTPPTTLIAPEVKGAPKTNDTTPEITGTCTDGDVITAQIGGADITPTATCTDGKYSITPETPLGEGEHEITVKAKDPAGNTTPASPKTNVTVDTTPPETPTNPPVVTGGPDVNSTTPEITGTCTTPNVVTVYVDGVAIDPTAVCDENGTFSITPEAPGLSEGEHNITITETDEGNNTSPQGPTPAIVVKVDTTPPEKPTVVSTVENNGTLTITGKTEPGATVKVTFPDGTVKTVTADDKGTYTATSDKPQREDGEVVVTATDAAGNISKPSNDGFETWYSVNEDSNGTTYSYGNDKTDTKDKTTIQIGSTFTVNMTETNEGDIELDISAPTTAPVPAVVAPAPAGCDAQSYGAFIKLYKEDGKVSTGYQYANPACNGIGDATLYKGTRLKFVPGTKARLEESTEKGNMVIIIDAQLNEATTFGEK